MPAISAKERAISSKAPLIRTTAQTTITIAATSMSEIAVINLSIRVSRTRTRIAVACGKGGCIDMEQSGGAAAWACLNVTGSAAAATNGL